MLSPRARMAYALVMPSQAIHWMPAVFSFIVLAAGWFYLFYSRAARNLAAIELASHNSFRSRLRRVGGFLMLLLGGGIFAGFYTVDQDAPGVSYVLVWSGVILVLSLMVLLAMMDLRLTWKLRRRQREMQSR